MPPHTSLEVYFCRSLRGKGNSTLSGTIPAAISTLVKLTRMCAPAIYWLSCSVGMAPVFIFFLLHSRLSSNALTGIFPSQMSTLTKLTYLYAPRLNKFTECWLCVYGVLVMCAADFQKKRSCCCFRSLGGNSITGTIPPQVSLLSGLNLLYALHNQFYWILAFCWVLACTVLSDILSVSVSYFKCIWYPFG